jgi:hypothetical protein
MVVLALTGKQAMAMFLPLLFLSFLLLLPLVFLMFLLILLFPLQQQAELHSLEHYSQQQLFPVIVMLLLVVGGEV